MLKSLLLSFCAVLVLALPACAEIMSPPIRPTAPPSGPAIRGRVTDAATGEPIKGFTVIAGGVGDSPGYRWLNRDPYVFSDGAYRIPIAALTENGWGPTPKAYVLRIDADGYAPRISPQFTIDKEITVDVQLSADKGITARALNLDGTPAVGARAYFARPMDHVGAYAGYVSARLSAVADSEGRFRFPPEIDPFIIVVAAENGFARVMSGEFKNGQDLTLAPFGEVTGRVMQGGAPLAKCPVRLHRMDIGDRGVQVSYEYSTESDAEGRFSFQRVAPGGWQIGETLHGWESHTLGVTVEPGKTAEVQIGGTGRPVTGAFSVPAEIKDSPKLARVEIWLEWRGELAGVDGMTEEQRRVWYLTRQSIECPRYGAIVDKDGKFRMEDVPPGDYAVGLIMSGSTNGGSEWLDHSHRPATIPLMEGGRSDEPFDLGTLAVHPDALESVVAKYKAPKAEDAPAPAPASPPVAKAPPAPTPRPAAPAPKASDQLSTCFRVKGAILDVDSSAALAGAQIDLQDAGARAGGYRWPQNIGLGSYEMEIPNARQMEDMRTHGFRLHIEVTGYLSQDSRVFPGDKPETVDFLLKKRQPPRGTVLTTDGKPAARALVFMNPTLVGNGGTVSGYSQASTHTNRFGSFSITHVSQPRRILGMVTIPWSVPVSVAQPYTVVVAGDDGFAEAPDSTFRADDVNITLQPWSKVTGRVMKDGAPLVDADVTIHRVTRGSSRWWGPSLRYDYKTKTDADGRFAFDRVAPVDATLSVNAPVTGASQVEKGLMNGLVCLYSVPLKAQPGRTIEISLGGTGRAVTGRYAGNHKPFPKTRLVCILLKLTRMPGKARPAGFDAMTQAEKSAWNAMWRADAAPDELTGRTYGAVADDDGAFRVSDVPPGKYSMEATEVLGMISGGNGVSTPVYRFDLPIEIPEAAPGRDGEPMDLGAVDPDVHAPKGL